MSTTKSRATLLKAQLSKNPSNQKNPVKEPQIQKAQEEEKKADGEKLNQHVPDEQMIEISNDKQLSELPSLKELNHALEQQTIIHLIGQRDSSDEEDQDDDSDMSGENSEMIKKRQLKDMSGNQDVKVTQNWILRKRDVKGNYKAKFNIEKLMIEHEKKQMQLKDLYNKRNEIQEQIGLLRSEIGKKQGTDLNEVKAFTGKIHQDYLLYEMQWMANDFEREHKKKITDLKKDCRMCHKQIQEKKLRKEKELKEVKVELKRKAQNMSKMVQMFWKSVEKVVKHNYNVLYEKKRQQIRAKKLESFVSKHLKLSVKVAEELNTKQFMEQSMKNANVQVNGGEVGEEDNNAKKIMKLYNSQDATISAAQIAQQQGDDQEIIQGEKSNKRRRINLMLVQDSNGQYEIDEEYEQEQQQINQQIFSQVEDHGQISRALLAEQTVEMVKSFQPTGFTLSSVQVKTKVPFLLHGSLREYQIIGLDWLVTLHNKKLNGILADEMGLGKTIQTIAMLASLACDKGVWGPHLIVVPTTIIINWEMEFKKWCPAFKILTYFGSQKERKLKRHGWSKENSFHVCITSYKLVIQDHFAFRRKKWYYMVLDEAQNIKNFKSQRWQTLLRFNTKRRLLLTGTPLQNDVMELWSLMHFLMPNIFSSQQDFKEWFSNPFNQSINQNQSLNISVVQKLQSILRPFLLRRMKKDVEKQLPEKVEHIVQCNLSRRQRLLYDEYINSDKTKQTLSDSDFFSIMNVLMQLRKVCNHPDLFEPRTIESPFIFQDRVRYKFGTFFYKAFQEDPLKDINYKNLNLILSEFESMSQLEYQTIQEVFPQRPLIQVIIDNKSNLSNLSDALMASRPTAEGYAIGKKLHINCNVLAKSNTKNLKHTIPSVFPYESNVFHHIPPYLNTACLPFAQEYYSLDSINELRYSSRQKPYTEFEVYRSALQENEQRIQLVRYAQKLHQWRGIDERNRFNLLFKQPVYGDDCKKAFKVNILFSDVFDVKRHKNVDRYSKNQISSQNELFGAAQSIFNPFACSLISGKTFSLYQQNNIENWPEQTEEQIETNNSQNPLIKEVPMSQQIKRRKKQQQLQQQQALKLQQQQLIQFQFKYETVKYTEKQFSLIIKKSALGSLYGKEDKIEEANVQMRTESQEEQKDYCSQENFVNANVEGLIEDIEKERVEERKIPMVLPSNLQFNLQGIANIGDLQSNLQEVQQEQQQKVSGVTNEDAFNESPYQRVYQNASKRYKKETQDSVIQLQETNKQEGGDNNESQQEKQQQQEKDTEMEDNEEKKIVGCSKEEGAVLDQKQDSGENKSIEKAQNDQLFQIDSQEGNKSLNQQESYQNTIQKEQQQQLQYQLEETEGFKQEEQKVQFGMNFCQEQEFQMEGLEEDFLNMSKNEDNNISVDQITYKNCENLRDLIITPLQRVSILEETIKQFKFIIPKVVAQTPEFIPTQIVTEHQKSRAYERFAFQKLMSHRNVNQSLKYSNILFFPHKNLIQYDCGKLQKLAQLLKTLHYRGHKVLIFTQMTRILDILENFLNLHGYTYVRLDGSVKVEMRQRLVDKFNLNKKIFCFISSTRCGGIGINLTGADCVIFYDTDWNPAMDKQAQDRCHRIGSKAKTINIYRLISTNTIEENIFKKSLQKRELGGLIIEGNFDMDFFKKVSLKDIIGDENFFKPKKIDIMREENIVFHLTGDDGANMVTTLTNSGGGGIGNNSLLNESMNGIQEENEMDYEKQRQIEQYRRRFEEALVRIEDKEDIIALQNAKREIDDEFDEEAALGHTEGTRGDSMYNAGGHEQQIDEEGIEQQHVKDQKGANQLQREMKKNEFVNWRSHPTLNEVTKMCIDYYEHNYGFDEYLDDRSKKDNKFINPLEKDEKVQEEAEEGEEGKEKEVEESEFSFSEEEEEMSQGIAEDWNQKMAESMYKGTKDEIESKYFIV